MTYWNPWHGCTKISPGCLNCYVYRRDEMYDKDSSLVHKTAAFSLPIQKSKNGSFKLQPEHGIIFTCFTSDFFHPASDPWRLEAWSFVKQRPDLTFFLVTKRPQRFYNSLPNDWGDGYENVHICCTCENQEMTDYRLPYFLELPIKHCSIIHEPLLESITLKYYLQKYHAKIEEVLCGGESGPNARICNYDWVLSIRKQCIEQHIPFTFRQTGANFYMNGRLYQISRKYQASQAKKANINYHPI